jgi:Tfp pilus assembly protein PilF
LIWRDSSALFRHVLTLDPEAGHAYANLATYLIQEHRLTPEDAAWIRGLAQDGIRKHPTPIAYTTLARLSKEQGDSEGALRAYQAARALNPKDPGILRDIGSVYSQLGKNTEAEEAFRSALALNERDPLSLNNLGAMALQRGETAAAEAMLTQAVSFAPYYSDAYYNLGLLYEQTNRPSQATSAFEHTLVAQPDLPLAVATVVKAHMDAQEYDAALNVLQRALEANPQEQRNAALAIDTVQGIIARDPNNEHARSFVRWMMDRGIVQQR